MAQQSKGERKLFSLRLPDDLHAYLVAYAGVKGTPLGDILIGWIRTAWNAQPEKDAIIKLVDGVATPGATPAKEEPKGKKAGAKAKKS